MKQPKILYFDIETMANLAWVWGKWEQNVIDFEREWYMISFAYKWNDGKTMAYSLPNFKTYKKDSTNDKELVTKLWELFNEAEIIIAHNGDSFDIKKSNARFLVHGLAPVSGYKTIDTKKVAKKYFQFNSNKLDDLGNLLGLGRKVDTGGFELWKGCLADNKKSWDKMVKYNKQDVDLLYKVYQKLKGWMVNHPNVNLYTDSEGKCPVCGSSNLIKRGYGYTKTGKYQRYQCKDCGAWSRGPIIRTNVDILQ
jgi:DNA polymerase elongation subunit (family B)/predicted RNA-binding Zn-ribbon protein involved in translation (DUF1610 family)